MTTYLDCQNMVSTLLNRRDATTPQIQAWIQNGLQRIQRELRCPAMEKVVVFTIGPTYSGGLVLPSDMIELIDLINSQGDRITKQDITTVNQLGAGFSNLPANFDYPRYYYRQANKWLLGPTPVQNDTVTCVYYAELAPLQQPGDTNAITVIASDLVAYGALCYAGDFFTDRRSDKWEQRYQQILGDLQGQGDDDELSGGATVSPAFFYPDPLDGGELYAEQFAIYP